MTKLLEQAIAGIKNLPEEDQNEIGKMLIDFAEQRKSKQKLSPEQIAEVQMLVDDPNPVYATEQQVDDMYNKLTT